jgi:hypothetical protein
MENSRRFDIFLCHKKSSGKDFADHLKAGLEELGYHTFLDSKDIPKMVDGKEEWIQIRDQAIADCNTFILLITPGFDLSPEVLKELRIARECAGKKFIYFRHRDLARKIILDLDGQKVDLGRQEQVSFESKEELLRLVHGILLKNKTLVQAKTNNSSLKNSMSPKEPLINDLGRFDKNLSLTCSMCSKPVGDQPMKEIIDGKEYAFDSQECVQIFKKLRRVYGENFQ